MWPYLYYVLCRWVFKSAKIPFDEANKLARSCHIELAIRNYNVMTKGIEFVEKGIKVYQQKVKE
ncbi:MAG: hypothetical protein RDU14_00815 [Melioribacteraceae bacterium]|nr:hypothetical protein [Melioribacteraceae bacterium]